VYRAIFIFYYICPVNAQYICKQLSVSYSTPTCFYVYASSSGSFLLCTLNLRIDKMEAVIKVVVLIDNKH